MLATILLLMVILLAVITIYIRRNYSSRTVPGLKPSDPKDGNMADIGKAGSLHEFLLELHQQFGEIASFWFGTQMIISLASPRLFKEVSHMFDRPHSLFAIFEPLWSMDSIGYANGEEGKERRRIYDASFSHMSIVTLYEMIQNNANKLVRDLSAKMATNEQIPLTDSMFTVSIKLSAMTTLGFPLQDNEELLKLRRSYDTCWYDMESRVDGNMPEPGSERVKKFNAARQELHDVIMAAIDKRKKNGAPPGENLLIDIMLDIGASDKIIFSDALTYLVAGVHTTGLGLAWTLYFLAKHEEFQTKVVHEIEEVLGEKDLSPDLFDELRKYAKMAMKHSGYVIKQIRHDVSCNVKIYSPHTKMRMNLHIVLTIMPSQYSMQYLRQVLDEMLRCSLLAPWIARFDVNKIEIAGYEIPGETPIIQSLGAVFSDANIYPEPEKFDPSRFEVGVKKSVPQFAFEPFGFAGKRKCPAWKLSLVEMTVVLVTLLRQFKFDLVPGQVVIKVYGMVTKPKEEIWVTLSPRN